MNLAVSIRRLVFSLAAGCVIPVASLTAADGDPRPALSIGVNSNGQPRLAFPFPAAESYTVYGASVVTGPYTTNVSGVLAGATFTVTNGGPVGFFQVGATPMSASNLFRANVLNRITYGPSLDDIARLDAIGPQAFIDEQLAASGGAGPIPEDLDLTPPLTNSPPPPPPLTNWIRVSATGTSTGTNLYIYLSAAGQVYLDDVRVVLGTNADMGPNLLLNGDFEDSPLTNTWRVSTDFRASTNVPSPTPDGLAASGTNCLLLIGTAAGSGNNDSVQQTFIAAPTPGTNYTVSFSYLTVGNLGASPVTFTVQLQGANTANVGANRRITLPYLGPVPPAAPVAVSPVYAKMASAAPPVNIATIPPVFTSINDLRAYHMLRAVQSKRQLYEILVQFFENHFTTEYQKLKDWFDNNTGNSITNEAVRLNLAVDMEWKEHQRFRQALLNTNCNFYDLLKISAEAPSMIIYLDTILSTRTAPNENYGRELLELHTMGSDNGYIQQDIVEMARVWTGWHVGKKDLSNADNPLAPTVASTTNDLGVYVLNFRANVHTTNLAKRLFTNGPVDPRFGPFRGGQPYSLIIGTNQYPATNGMQEGYVVLNHLANLPQTMEFLSVKLCQVFVHENFEYGVYDYNSPATPEAQLIKECMTAWDTPADDGRKGNIRAVLRAIFSSPLFQGHATSQQKIKTPLEFAVSAVRALRTLGADTNGYITAAADTDGYGLTSPLSRMGGMSLFNRPEPDGYSELGSIWLNTANLDERWRFAQHLLMAANFSLKNTDYGTTRNISDPSRLVRERIPSGNWNDAGVIVDFFLGILYPGEGTANLALDRQAAIDYLNTNEAGASSTFNFATHDGRVRGMVALLMCFPRFQEQ